MAQQLECRVSGRPGAYRWGAQRGCGAAGLLARWVGTSVKVVLAGGSGLIGRALCSALVQLGHLPVVLSRSPRRAAPRLPAGVRCVEWHPPQLSDWTAELVGAAAVINLAGESVGVWPWTARRKRVLRESRIIPTQILVTALAALPRSDRPRVLVSASGSDVYEGEDEVAATGGARRSGRVRSDEPRHRARGPVTAIADAAVPPVRWWPGWLRTPLDELDRHRRRDGVDAVRT
ncbi:MAG: NAD-dependent epimerase/dehydratase family protein [Actinobacteria bacterium]|nr:MAG: NAD-dependent epimerase/dehydratase family protein [Actinomycetota bacterium]